ncbi:serine carboxypeptidase-like 33 isoform 4 [Corchorus olitorius]|uniref:Serine carboxypeptidase-like 33 isoform 4 n=1 Tax=Corchorus olitorius TaxID=93759 RepID=A0A1R3G1G4_9ROSI|nr:serine carboxypeptidase-like 33 isoform 4 [Corchorus olitorius]
MVQNVKLVDPGMNFFVFRGADVVSPGKQIADMTCTVKLGSPQCHSWAAMSRCHRAGAAVYKEETLVHTWGLLLYLNQPNKAFMGT